MDTSTDTPIVEDRRVQVKPEARTVTAIWPGRSYPRGAHWDGEGVNFALFSENAEKVELCLFDESGRREIQRITLPEHSDEV